MKRAKPHKRPAPTPRTAQVQIEKPIYGGSFLARIEGKATFVPLTLPGEEARVRIVEDKRNYSTAEPEAVVIAAPNRIAPQCPHFGACGGCNYQHADYETQLKWKEDILRETLQRGGMHPLENISILSGDPWHYRNRIRIGFYHAGRVGYRARRSHDIISIRECPIAAPLLVRAALALEEILSSRQSFRPTEISLFCNADETQLLASIYVQSSSTRQEFEKFSAAWQKLIPAIVGIELVEEGRPGFDARQLARTGNLSIAYRTGGVDYRVDHGAFFQVNRWLIDRLVSTVIGERHGTLAWDLFAGVGLFSRRLTERFAEVIAVESSPQAKLALAANLEGTSGRSVDADILSFLKTHRQIARPDLIVVDPPRAGLGADTAALLADTSAPSIVYVSCDPATLARDLNALLKSGYSLASVTLADLFPQTFHLETVVELQRS
jgi:23S rRNA (uracil1939-C5)-methyltransferase